jgi:hypothetical protein
MQVGGEIHIPTALPPSTGERAPGAHSIGGWVGDKAGRSGRCEGKKNLLPMTGLERQ